VPPEIRMGRVRTSSCGGKRPPSPTAPQGPACLPRGCGGIMMRRPEMPPRVQTHRRTLSALVRRGSGCWRALTGCQEAITALRAALWSAWAARHVPGRDASGSGEKRCGGVDVGQRCRGRTSGRAPPVPRQRRAQRGLTMPLAQGHGRQSLTPEGAPPAARARGVREEIFASLTRERDTTPKPGVAYTCLKGRSALRA